MTISINDLVLQLSTLGVIETAINGAFHDLPGSGGGGGTSNVKMLQAVASHNGGPPGNAVAAFTYGFDTPLTVQPFLQAVVLNPTVDYSYTVQTFGNDDFSGATVLVNFEWIGNGADPNTGEPVNVGLRVEPFVAT